MAAPIEKDMDYNSMLNLTTDDIFSKWKQPGDNNFVISTDYMSYSFPNDQVEHIANVILSAYDYEHEIQFDFTAECMPFGILTPVDKIVRILVANNISTDKIKLLSGGSPSEDNHILYKKHCVTYDFVELEIRFIEMHEIHANNKIKLDVDLYDNNIRTAILRPKKFLCLNRNPKVHRIALVAELMRHNLVQDAYVSCYINGTEEDGCVGYYGVPYENVRIQLATNGENIANYIKDHEHVFPLRLTLGQDLNNCYDISEELYLFNDSYFGVITESKFFHDVPDIYFLKSDLSLDGIVFTEKTWKFITAKQPFIIAGFTHSIKRLRDMGYKSFHPYINESYDDIEDDEERLMAIVNEIKRLSAFSDDEWLEFQQNTIPIAEHNYNKLRNV